MDFRFAVFGSSHLEPRAAVAWSPTSHESKAKIKVIFQPSISIINCSQANSRNPELPWRGLRPATIEFKTKFQVIFLA